MTCFYCAQPFEAAGALFLADLRRRGEPTFRARFHTACFRGLELAGSVRPRDDVSYEVVNSDLREL